MPFVWNIAQQTKTLTCRFHFGQSRRHDKHDRNPPAAANPPGVVKTTPGFRAFQLLFSGSLKMSSIPSIAIVPAAALPLLLRLTYGRRV
jgi:hypothetical protein